MEQSKVYFTSFRTTKGENLLKKFERLLKSAGIEEIDFEEKFVAIKMHLGEYGNLASLRPQYVKTLADYVKKLGGKPFLTDANTLYVGSRKDALEHIESAYLNGYSPLQTGCHVIIADGLKGTDEAIVPIDGEYVKNARIGRAIMDADVVISLTHFKGHELTGFGGAIKNIGMGSGSRMGKMEQHSDGKPRVKTELCIGCGRCIQSCAHDAPSVTDGKASIDKSKCVGCGRCLANCPKGAIASSAFNSEELLSRKMAEYAYAVVKDRPAFHVSLIVDVSPACDCDKENDTPIIPNVGMLASLDPVALDQACADLCCSMPIIENSEAGENLKNHHHDEHTDLFHITHPNTHWQDSLEQAEKIGMGSRKYELIEV